MPHSPTPEYSNAKHIAELVAELATRRIIEEVNGTLSKEVGHLTTEVRVLNTRLIGNGAKGLIQRFEELQAKVDDMATWRTRLSGGWKMACIEAGILVSGITAGTAFASLLLRAHGKQ